MRLIPFGAFQAMLGILFAMTVVLALLATASGKSFQGSSTMLAILLLGLQRAEIVTWWADSFREGGGRRMRWTWTYTRFREGAAPPPQRQHIERA